MPHSKNRTFYAAGDDPDDRALVRTRPGAYGRDDVMKATAQKLSRKKRRPGSAIAVSVFVE